MAKIYYFSDKVSSMATTSKIETVTTVYDVAKTFLTFEPMTHKKLQKLCYYAYSWYLTLYKEKLFDEHFEAWIHGPVSPALYSEYKQYGWKEIPQADEVPEDILLNEDAYSLIEEVYHSYGHLSGDDLEYLTHQEDPWLVARDGLPEYAPSNNKLDDHVIVNYYRKVFEEGQND
jgi:uncharacterized phage-associated protein